MRTKAVFHLQRTNRQLGQIDDNYLLSNNMV